MYITTPDSVVPSTVVFHDGSHGNEAMLVGPSLFGWVYRSSCGTTWYRLFPSEQLDHVGQSELEWRHRFRTQTLPPSSSILTAQRDWHQLFEDESWLVVAYESARPGKSLAEHIRGKDATLRMRSAVAALRALPEWWNTLELPILPLPADIVVSDDGSIQLLWIPRPRLPDSNTAVANPERILHMPPELLRSAANVAWDIATWKAVDLYAIGVTLLGCYCQLPDVQRPVPLMQRAATGSLFQKLQARCDLPPWLERFSNHRNTVSGLHRLTSPVLKTRLEVDLGKLADRLERSLALFDPRSAVAWLRDQAKPQEALDLLQELFPLTASLEIDTDLQYDLLCMAGELCARYLRRVLDALDYYERAIDLNGHRREAYREQLRVIASSPHHMELADIVESNSPISTDLDMKLWRNYRFLVGGRTTHASNDDDEMDDRSIAHYTLSRRQYDVACDFIKPRLLDETGRYIWWDFELMLALGWAFLGIGDRSNLELASQQIQQIKNGLEYVRRNCSLEMSLVQQYGDDLSDLEYRVFVARSSSSPLDTQS